MNDQSNVGQRKRRGTARRKTSRPSISPKEVGPTWLNEAAAIGVGGLGIFLAWGILESLFFSEVPNHKPSLGPIGASGAKFLLGTFGWSSFVLVGYLLLLSKFFWRDDLKIETLKRSSIAVVSRLIGLISLAVSSALVGAALFGDLAGGSVGSVLATPAISAFNTGGTFILGAVAFVVSLALATGRSIQGLFAYLFSLTQEFLTFLFSLSSMVLAGAWRGAQSLAAGFGELVIGPKLWRRIAMIFSASARDIEVVEKTPKPRVRRNLLPLSPGSEDSDKLSSDPSPVREDGSDPEQREEASDDYSHVVVMRRNKADEKSEKKKAKPTKTPPAFTDINDAFPDYEVPDLALLTKGEQSSGGEDDEELRQKSRLIELKLRDFGVFGRVTQVHPGPVITLFEFEPAPGVKVGRIAALQDDLAMSLKATSIRIIAPLPKLGTVGIEVPNRNRDTVRLRDVLESPSFIGADSTLTIGLGKDTYGEPVSVDLAQMPHLLMAGSTGTGKSVCINAILMSLLYRAHPSELGLILIDPKILELSIYEDIPHLRVPVVTVPRQARAVLDWAAQEMDRRYRLMQKYGVRNIDGYNAIARGEVDPENVVENQVLDPAPQVVNSADPAEVKPESQSEDVPPIVAEVLRPLPKIVIVIDELADLMLTVGREIEELITRLAQKARASGIHLILATQRPSVDVITGLIKANFPARLSFRVSSRVDSRTILDSMGAEKLLGRGDMLFMQPGAEAIRRIHGAFIADGEVKRVVEFIKKRAKPCYDERIMHLCQKALEEQKNDGSGSEDGDNEYDEVYDRAVELVMQKGQASTSMIQRVFRIGYNRAARIIEVMERDGIIGPMDGAKPREVLVQNRDEAIE